MTMSTTTMDSLCKILLSVLFTLLTLSSTSHSAPSILIRILIVS